MDTYCDLLLQAAGYLGNVREMESSNQNKSKRKLTEYQNLDRGYAQPQYSNMSISSDTSCSSLENDSIFAADFYIKNGVSDHDNDDSKNERQRKSNSKFKEETGNGHNSIEKKRRAYLSLCYKQLKRVVPFLSLAQRTSNVRILRDSLAFIKSLEDQERNLCAEKAKIKTINEKLRKQRLVDNAFLSPGHTRRRSLTASPSAPSVCSLSTRSPKIFSNSNVSNIFFPNISSGIKNGHAFAENLTPTSLSGSPIKLNLVPTKLDFQSGNPLPTIAEDGVMTTRANQSPGDSVSPTTESLASPIMTVAQPRELPTPTSVVLTTPLHVTLTPVSRHCSDYVCRKQRLPSAGSTEIAQSLMLLSQKIPLPR